MSNPGRGDLLVMMTDRVLDMMEDGEERIAQVLEGLQNRTPPKEIAEKKYCLYHLCLRGTDSGRYDVVCALPVGNT